MGLYHCRAASQSAAATDIASDEESNGGSYVIYEYPGLASVRCVMSLSLINPLEFRANYSATSNKMKLVHWPLMGGLLHLVPRRGLGRGHQPA